MRRDAAVMATLVALLPAAACTDERRYVGDGELYQVALTESTAPAFAAEDGALFVVEQRIELPVLRPSQTVLEDLRESADRYDDLPFRRVPWVKRDDLAIELDFTLSNLDDAAREVAVTVNGWNEFHEYVPGVNVVDDQVTPDFAQWERLYRLDPEARLARTIREEEFEEMAVDLATVVNGAPNSNTVVYFANESREDERSRPFIPEVIPGLVGFRLGLRATAAMNVLLEASVRVRELEDRLADDGDAVLEPNPEPFMPVAPEL